MLRLEKLSPERTTGVLPQGRLPAQEGSEALIELAHSVECLFKMSTRINEVGRPVGRNPTCLLTGPLREEGTGGVVDSVIIVNSRHPAYPCLTVFPYRLYLGFRTSPES